MTVYFVTGGRLWRRPPRRSRLPLGKPLSLPRGFSFAETTPLQMRCDRVVSRLD